MEGSETGCGRVWMGVRMEEVRRGVDGCGRGGGWKMEGSETGCGRVWTGVRMEDGGERDGVWTGVDGGEDGRWRARQGVDGCGRSETGCGRVWSGARMKDGGERDGVWTGVG